MASSTSASTPTNGRITLDNSLNMRRKEYLPLPLLDGWCQYRHIIALKQLAQGMTAGT